MIRGIAKGALDAIVCIANSIIVYAYLIWIAKLDYEWLTFINLFHAHLILCFTVRAIKVWWTVEPPKE